MIAGPPAKPSLLRLDSASREALTRFLSHPRYEVLPSEEAGDLVLRNVPTEVTITVTSSPRRDLHRQQPLLRRARREEVGRARAQAPGAAADLHRHGGSCGSGQAAARVNAHRDRRLGTIPARPYELAHAHDPAGRLRS